MSELTPSSAAGTRARNLALVSIVLVTALVPALALPVLGVDLRTG